MTLSRYLSHVASSALFLLVMLVGVAAPAHAQSEPDRSPRLPGASVQVGSLRIPALAFSESPTKPIVWQRPVALRVGLQSTSSQSSWRSRHPSKFGALVGLGVGAVIGALESRNGCWLNGEGTCAAFSALVFGGMGAGVGALVGLGF
jgi:hypothetical protein